MVLGVPCEFHILNPIGDPNVEGQGFVVIDARNGPAEPQLAMLLDFLLRNGPRGVTPLTKRSSQPPQLTTKKSTNEGGRKSVYGTIPE